MTGFLYGLNLCLDIYVSKQFQHNTNRKYVGWNDIVHSQLNADVVIMGNSRAWVHYSPAIMDSILHTNSYNLGMDGSNLNRQIIKYEVYTYYQKVKPKYLIMNIDYVHSLGWTTGYEREQFFPYMLNSYMRQQIRKVEPFSFMELYIPLYRYTTYQGLFSIFREASAIEGIKLYKGYKGLERIWDGKDYNEIETFHFCSDERTIKMFDEFLYARHKEGTHIIFCFAPIYSGLTAKVDNLQEVYDTYQALANKYEIPILDYTYADICSDTTYFYNATHLTRQGSEIFSTQLAHDIDSLGLFKLQ